MFQDLRTFLTVLEEITNLEMGLEREERQGTGRLESPTVEMEEKSVPKRLALLLGVAATLPSWQEWRTD